jgi:hypothetical protein
VAVLLGHAGESVELRRVNDNSIAESLTTSAAQTDEDSGDSYSTVDFSAVTETGEFYLFLPGADLRSYNFEISDDVYDIVGLVATKSFYYQRCNHDRVLPYASGGMGGEWVDGVCHTGDYAAPAGPGSVDHGALDLRGGWHDAGDYQKTLWGRGIPEMLFAYEVNPSAWADGRLRLAVPESGNGVPDLLDELRWELDFYVRMQRPDGHFMTSVKGNGGTVNSPPSASDEGRVYFDCTSPSGDGWSGGGVTIGEATGNAVLSLAHAAVVFRSAGQTTLADGYQAAAAAGWAWLNAFSPQNDKERRLRAAAAAAVYRMDSTQTSARDHAQAFDFSTWDGLLPWSVTPSENVIAAGAWHMLSNPAVGAAKKTEVEVAVGQAIVERAFQEEGVYGGMFGDSDDGWNWGWGSNRAQAFYGANLLMAVRFGILGGRSEDEVRFRAYKHFHYMLGLNPLNMVYLSNMAAYGGEHSSFQIYHAWFSYTGGDGDNGNAQYNGKPDPVVEPLYPYHPDDTQTSVFGPAPGLVPGGPNWYYSCSYQIPNRTFPAYAYRDFSVSCDWDGAQCRACSWEITEPMAAYQGPFILLAAFMMSGG